MWFKATVAGKYEVPCAELCGFGHSGMRGWVYVDTPEKYEAWARRERRRPRRRRGRPVMSEAIIHAGRTATRPATTS